MYGTDYKFVVLNLYFTLIDFLEKTLFYRRVFILLCKYLYSILSLSVVCKNNFKFLFINKSLSIQKSAPSVSKFYELLMFLKNFIFWISQQQCAQQRSRCSTITTTKISFFLSLKPIVKKQHHQPLPPSDASGLRRAKQQTRLTHKHAQKNEQSNLSDAGLHCDFSTMMTAFFNQGYLM